MPKPRSRPARRKPALVVLPDVIKPIIPILVKPIVKPVIERLDSHEKLLHEVKAALDIQFKRIAAIQAQLDHLVAKR